jgi:hypothetical protein
MKLKAGKILLALMAVMLLVFPQVNAAAQSTRVKGRVTDAETGEGVPFAGLVFEGTTIGLSADIDGYYTIETRDPNAKVLVCMLLGYDTEKVEIKQYSFNEVNFKLKLTDNRLNAAVVKPDNSRMKRILANIDKNRDRNDPDKQPEYQADVYTKMELDLTNAEEQIKSKSFRKNFGFVFDYMDTSVISGQPYLPVMISENKAHRYHKNNPAMDREVVEASRTSGINDETTVAQFTGSLYMKTNFYNSFINAFDVNIPSPLSPTGDLFYNYYLIDSTYYDGHKTYHIRFHPGKLVSSPVFDGEMFIDTQNWGLRELHVKLKKGSNVNWLRDLVIDVKNQLVNDSTWFFLEDKMYADFSVTMRDSSKVMSFLGNRTRSYSNPQFFLPDKDELDENGDNVMVKSDVGEHDEDYWQSVRPYRLTEKEQNIYSMVDSIKTVPLFKNLYSIVSTIVVGYYDFDKFGLGPYFKVFSFNNLEGVRLQLGLRTNANFNKKVRYMVYGAYGFKDAAFKGGGSVEYVFNTQPTRKLTFEAYRDVKQLGKGINAFTESNILSSILSKSGSQKLSPINSFSLVFDHEWNPRMNDKYAIESKRVFSNKYVPMIKPNGEIVNSVSASQFHYSMRFSWNETVTRGRFTKTYVYTKYPVVTIDLFASTRLFGKTDYSFFRPELNIDYKLPIPPIGTSRITLNAGHIFGKVPYPFLKLHEGNGTYVLDRSAFACMDFYEFASDTWCQIFWEHNFGGFFLGKIPLLRKMQLREVVTVKAAYGSLTKRNNGKLELGSESQAELLFPEGMSDLNKPYVEVGVGVTNILRLFRIDAFWRTTHRYETVNGERKKSDHCFALDFGIELSF